MKKRDIDTRVIHGRSLAPPPHGSLSPPLFQTSTFSFSSAEEGAQRFAGEQEGFVYSRLGNPTVQELEEKIADVENGEAGLACSSGMAAISAVLTSTASSGDHVLVSEGIYGCTYGFFQLMKERYHVDYTLLNMEDEQTIEQEIRPNTKAIYVETPINPTMKLVDLDMIHRIAKKYNLFYIVDNTFSSPILQRPLEHGADVVLHSATKYIGGHGDVIAGLAVGKNDFISHVRKASLKDMGGILSPFDAWLLLRGIKTLSLRMQRHTDNAKLLSKKLKDHDKVKKIYYPGDTGFAQHVLAAKQMDDFGGLISFELKGGKKAAASFMNQLKMIKIAVSLGDAETLIQHPATMTHAVVPESVRKEMGISDSLLRLSVGLESAKDIWADIEQALTTL
ncbi:methionine-gamma-lyase [Alteribacillus persepolensis]|uniref:L-methionine gamma-lyase n=1 Tax=Alteribacillus persepolensis TaxID=568899 RepID=A0A1G8FJ79_9BACI|nr:methionine gamma-lyase [Alteribacillus persepolensis]SDH82096.1 methionine-gamma-lyase [Alteribacillus persepolensis]